MPFPFDQPHGIAVCTWLFGNHDHPQIAQQVARLGADSVEILADITLDSPRRLRRLYTDAGLTIVSLTPDNVDIAHHDKGQRSEAICYYQRLIQFAADLDCPRVTCHEGIGRICPVDSREAEWDRLVAACQYLASVAADQGVSLIFEPLHRGLVSQIHRVEEVCRLVDTVGSPNLSVVLDTYHLCFEEVDPVAAIQQWGRRVAAVQLGDTDRRPLGMGTAPIAACLEGLEHAGFTGPWILECTSQLSGPSLTPRVIDLVQVEKELRDSLGWLRSQIH